MHGQTVFQDRTIGRQHSGLNLNPQIQLPLNFLATAFTLHDPALLKYHEFDVSCNSGKAIQKPPVTSNKSTPFKLRSSISYPITAQKSKAFKNGVSMFLRILYRLLLGPASTWLGSADSPGAPVQKSSAPLKAFSQEDKITQNLEQLACNTDITLQERLLKTSRLHFLLARHHRKIALRSQAESRALLTLKKLFLAEGVHEEGLKMVLQYSLQKKRPEIAQWFVERAHVQCPGNDALILALAEWHFNCGQTALTQSLINQLSLKSLSRSPRLACMWLLWNEKAA